MLGFGCAKCNALEDAARAALIELGMDPTIGHATDLMQIAEVLGRLLASDVFDSYSAGIETKPQINQDAVRLMKQIYGTEYFHKLFSALCGSGSLKK